MKDLSEQPLLIDFMELIEDLYQQNEKKLTILGDVDEIGLDDIENGNVSLKIIRTITFNNSGDVYVETTDIFPIGKNGRVDLQTPLSHDINFGVSVQYIIPISMESNDIKTEFENAKKKLLSYFSKVGASKMVKSFSMSKGNEASLVLINEKMLPIDTVKAPEQTIPEIDKLSKAIFNVADKIDEIIK